MGQPDSFTLAGEALPGHLRVVSQKLGNIGHLLGVALQCKAQPGISEQVELIAPARVFDKMLAGKTDLRGVIQTTEDLPHTTKAR